MLRLLKQVVNEAAGEKNTGGVAVLTRPTPSCQNSSFPGWGTLRIFRDGNDAEVFQRIKRLLKISASKAAGSGTTEAYPCGTSQGGTRLRTKLGKERVSARWGWAGENIGIFSSRPRGRGWRLVRP
jgi:hypothetical protein